MGSHSRIRIRISSRSRRIIVNRRSSTPAAASPRSPPCQTPGNSNSPPRSPAPARRSRPARARPPRSREGAASRTTITPLTRNPRPWRRRSSASYPNPPGAFRSTRITCGRPSTATTCRRRWTGRRRCSASWGILTITITTTGRGEGRGGRLRRPGGGPTQQLSPKNYYELHMRALDELPNLEEFLLGLAETDDAAEAGAGTGTISAPSSVSAPNGSGAERRRTMREIYDAVQHTPRVVPRLYLQICAGSALIRSGEAGPRTVLEDLVEAVKCVQSPIRGLFLRHYLLQATRDKLPNAPAPPGPSDSADSGAGAARAESRAVDEAGGSEGEGGGITAESGAAAAKKGDAGTVEDAYTFVLSNFIEMNKLWVRIQNLSGERSNKEARKRREKERNELRLLVGTNLVRLSQLEGVSSEVYGSVILPQILDQIAACRDPLAQAYLMDCIIQVFPDEFHIETLEVFLGVCPKLREKVNIRTIVQSMMERLANYYADASLFEGEDTYGIKGAISTDSFQMFDNCTRSIFEARGATMPPKEVIRLETALLNFSLRCYPGRMDHISRCLGVCAASLRGEDTHGAIAAARQETDPINGQAPMATSAGTRRPLDEAAIDELEKLLSIPLDSLALKVLELEHYSDLLTFLPWDNRCQVAVVMLTAVQTSGKAITDVRQVEELFSIITPLTRNAETARSAIDEAGGAVNRTTDLMGALGVALGTGESFNKTADPAAAAAEGGNATGITPFSPAFRQEQVLVAKLVHLLIHDNTDIAYQMLVVARKHLCKGPVKSLFYAITCLILFAASLSHYL